MGCRAMVYEGNEPYLYFSYCREDSAAVNPIIEMLAAAGYRVWYDNGIRPGEKRLEEIAAPMAGSTAVLAAVTEASSASHDCRSEVNLALKSGKTLLPILLKDVSLSLAQRLLLEACRPVKRYELKSDADLLSQLEQAADLKACRGSVPLLVQAALRVEADMRFCTQCGKEAETVDGICAACREKQNAKVEFVPMFDSPEADPAELSVVVRKPIKKSPEAPAAPEPVKPAEAVPAVQDAPAAPAKEPVASTEEPAAPVKAPVAPAREPEAPKQKQDAPEAPVKADVPAAEQPGEKPAAKLRKEKKAVIKAVARPVKAKVKPEGKPAEAPVEATPAAEEEPAAAPEKPEAKPVAQEEAPVMQETVPADTETEAEPEDDGNETVLIRKQPEEPEDDGEATVLLKRHSEPEEDEDDGEKTVFKPRKRLKPAALFLPSDGTLYRLEKAVVSIGRKQDNDIVIADGSVSGNHAGVKLDGPEPRLMDMGSTNGTKLAGIKLEAKVFAALPEVSLVEFDDIPAVLFTGPAVDRFLRERQVAWLTCEETGARRLLEQGELLLGRSYAWADGTLKEPSISRKHAAVTLREDGIFLRDEGSANGTFLNGTALEAGKEYPISDGDAFFLSDTACLKLACPAVQREITIK